MRKQTAGQTNYFFLLPYLERKKRKNIIFPFYLKACIYVYKRSMSKSMSTLFSSEKNATIQKFPLKTIEYTIQIKGTWSVHSFNGDYLSHLSIPSAQVAVGTFFMKSSVDHQ